MDERLPIQRGEERAVEDAGKNLGNCILDHDPNVTHG